MNQVKFGVDDLSCKFGHKKTGMYHLKVETHPRNKIIEISLNRAIYSAELVII